jgi:hypothetical protein
MDTETVTTLLSPTFIPILPFLDITYTTNPTTDFPGEEEDPEQLHRVTGRRTRRGYQFVEEISCSLIK